MARVFRFRLQKILDLRLGEEKTAELALAAVTGECRRLELAIQDLLARTHRSLLTRPEALGDWTALRSYDLYAQRLGKEVEQNEKRLAAKLVEREEKLAVYNEARKKVKVLEKLEEKRRAEFKAEREKAETARLDDLNTAAFIRKMGVVEDVVG